MFCFFFCWFLLGKPNEWIFTKQEEGLQFALCLFKAEDLDKKFEPFNFFIFYSFVQHKFYVWCLPWSAVIHRSCKSGGALSSKFLAYLGRSMRLFLDQLFSWDWECEGVAIVAVNAPAAHKVSLTFFREKSNIFVFSFLVNLLTVNSNLHKEVCEGQVQGVVPLQYVVAINIFFMLYKTR